MFTFKKEERLCNERLIKLLFQKGSSFLVYPFRVVYWQSEEPAKNFPSQILISVPKRRFKRAPDRNRLKRQIRETFRLNKKTFYEQLPSNKNLLIFSVAYIANEKLEYNFLDQKMKKLLKKLLEKTL